jgi:hypothetical protein
MRDVTTQTTDAWKAAFKGGDIQPMARATIQTLDILRLNYNLRTVPYAKMQGTGVFTCAVFGQSFQPIELPNIASISWERSTTQDVASCTLVLWNTEPLPLGSTPEDESFGAFERPGYFTFNHGTTTEQQTRWGHEANGWQGLLAPDRVIRTYEGYGFDPLAPPDQDEHMYPSGVWLIDDVAYDANGLITVTCRDIGRLLIDQIMFPPVVPFNQYPLTFQSYHDVTVTPPPQTVRTTGWSRPKYDTDSNIPYIGKGFTDGGVPYVSSTGAVRGHHGKHAFDTNKTSYWLSVGNYPNWSSAYEYVQGKFSSRTLRAVKIKTFGGPYTYYISVYAGGAWKGTKKIPYKARAVDTNADIRFVKSGRIGKDKEAIIELPKAYSGATAVRITLTDLYDTGIGEFRWRGGIRDIQINSTTATTVQPPNTTTKEGNYGDYTDIVQYLCAWGGFYWPKAGTTNYNYVMSEDGTKTYHTPVAGASSEMRIAGHHVWGQFEDTATQGKVDLGVEIWDKKPLMDGISYIRDIVNFLFFIDENGGVVWRSPNIWEVGNFISPPNGGPNIVRTTDLVEIDEAETLMGMTATLSSRNIRERIFVANVTGNYGAMAQGYNPQPSGIRRVAGWTDQNFRSTEECQIMADLIAIRSMFTYRKNTLQIPGYPAIQIDDQVRIYEATTAESFVHYVDSISSEFDMQTRQWTYSLNTHWLGEEPFDKWAFNPYQLSLETREYLQLLGKIT